jgi:CRP/FNR family transcriptional regulator
MPITTRDILAALQLPEDFPPDLLRELEETGQAVTAPAGTALYGPGEMLDSFIMVGAGVIRVVKSSEDGREIALYSVGQGECCTINMLCLLSNRPSPASAYVGEDLVALGFPRDRFLAWFAAHAPVRDLVMNQMADRVHAMMTLVEEVAFQKLDRRLAAHLLEATSSAPAEPLAVTHEAIALELGSVREVVSRILKNFEHARLVELGRGRIRVLDRDQLSTMSS